MTGDELAARLYAEQGYFVIAGSRPLKLGAFVPSCVGPEEDKLQTPLRVVAVSSLEEMRQQDSLAMKIDPSIGPPVSFTGPYYYRVEAAD